MSRALLTMGVGRHAELLALSLPGMRTLADAHGYDLRVVEPPPYLDPWWGKPAVLLDALDEHDEALFLDADVLVHDPAVDPAAELSDDRWLVLGGDPRCDINCGIWAVRDVSAARGFLMDVIAMRQAPGHFGGENEQSAVRQLLPSVRSVTTVLGPEFGDPLADHPAPCMQHCTSGYDTVDEKRVRMADELGQRAGAVDYADVETRRDGLRCDPPDLTAEQVDEHRRLARTISDRALGPPRLPAQILRDVLELLEDENRWFSRTLTEIATEDYALLPDGRSSWWGDPRAVQWFIGGAVFLVGRNPAFGLPSPKVPMDELPTDFDDTPTSDERVTAGAIAFAVFQEELGEHVVRQVDHAHVVASLGRAIARLDAERPSGQVAGLDDGSGAA